MSHRNEQMTRSQTNGSHQTNYNRFFSPLPWSFGYRNNIYPQKMKTSERKLINNSVTNK